MHNIASLGLLLQKRRRSMRMLTQFPDPVCQQNQLQDQCPIALALLHFSNSGWSQKTLKSRPPSKMMTQFAGPVCQTFLVLVKSKHLVACLAWILQMLTMTMAETERTISRSFRKDGTKKPSNCLMLLYLWSSKIHKNWKQQSSCWLLWSWFIE